MLRKPKVNDKIGYKLSNEADGDLEDIFDYTKKEHSLHQAIKYLHELEEVFNQIVQNPAIGKERIELKATIFSLKANKHLVFYQIKPNYILIVRVLHGRRDLPKFIK